MKEEIKYLVLYSGNHTGILYENDLMGICNNENDAMKMIHDLLEEDKNVYTYMDYPDEIPYTSSCRIGGIEGKWYCYTMFIKKVYTI